MEDNKTQIKRFYIEDSKSIDEICTALNINRQTFYYHKKRDKDRGVDWDELRVANQQSKEDLAQKETRFISALITNFEKHIERLEEESPEEAVAIIAKYIKTYHKIKHPVNKSCKQEKLAGANEALKIIGNIAIVEDKKEIALFLSERAEEIISKISKIT